MTPIRRVAEAATLPTQWSVNELHNDNSRRSTISDIGRHCLPAIGKMIATLLLLFLLPFAPASAQTEKTAAPNVLLIVSEDTVADELVSTVDLLPTLVELAGLPPCAENEGQSLVPLLHEPNRPWTRPVVTTHGRGNHAVRSQHFRYTRYSDGTEELCDHRSDPND